jgi:thermolysin
MKRTTAVAAAIAATLTFSLAIGRAQQPSRVQIRATTGNELRSWDGWVTQALRTGELRALRVGQDPALPGHTTERMQQFHNGVPIWGAQVVRDSSIGVAVSIFGELSPALTLETRPTLSAESARQQLLASAPAGATLLRPPVLTILRMKNGEHRLAYSAVVSASVSVFRVFIDAHSGVELQRYSELKTQAAVGTGKGAIGDTKKLSVALQAGAYRTDDQQRPPVLRTYDMRGDRSRAIAVLDGFPLFDSDLGSDSDNEWTDPAVVDAHAYIGWTYDYYFKRHGRRGIDNNDRPIISLVNGVRQQDGQFVPLDDLVLNAFWCAVCGPGNVGVMYFGNGLGSQYLFDFIGSPQSVGYFAGSLDVAAHELTHAVTEYTSGLIYQDESGALNEAFSDIMGVSVEFLNQPLGAGVGQADYLIGEDTFRSPFGSLNGLRSMVSPVEFGQPDHYSIRYTGTEDNGGVHINSGIANHAFYLAIEGGTHRLSGVAVQGVGTANREQIEKVFYRAFTVLLPANATFATARAATIQAARDLYGVDSAAERAVTQAWNAVGVL